MIAGEPYRVPGAVEPPPAASEDLGALRSAHRPPPLGRALVGPLLVSGLIAGVFAITGATALLLAPFAAACFALLAWGPLRLHGLSIELHDAGLVVSRRGVARAVAFEDVDEVWFELDPLRGQTGTAIRALRLATYGREVYRVPLGVVGAATLVNAVLGACSAPLLVEARKAFAAGETLTFGDVRIDRAGITVARRSAPWSSIRLAVVQRGAVALYRRFPIFAWRTVRLDRMPHPTLFLALVASAASRLRVDDPFIVPFASTAEHAAAARGGADGALRAMLIGGAFFVVGAMLTWGKFPGVSCAHPVAYGPMIFGAVWFFQGLRTYLSRR